MMQSFGVFFIVLSSTFLARAQSSADVLTATTSTATLYPGAFFDGISLEGEVRGTGADGTTYALVGVETLTQTATTETIPFTMTLVEDSTHLSEFVDLPDPGIGGTFTLSGSCSLPTDVGSDVICTEVGAEAGQQTTITQTRPFSLAAVPIGTGSVPIGELPASVSVSSAQETITALSTSNTVTTTSVAQTTSTNSAGRIGPYGGFVWGGLSAVVVIVFSVICF